MRTAAVCAVLALLALACADEPAPPPPPTATPAPVEAVAIDWMESLPDALERARTEDEPVLAIYTVDWCVWCARMLDGAEADPALSALISRRVIPVRVDVQAAPDSADEARVDELPTTIVLAPDGTELGRIAGYAPPKHLREQIEAMLDPPAR